MKDFFLLCQCQIILPLLVYPSYTDIRLKLVFIKRTVLPSPSQGPKTQIKHTVMSDPIPALS